jgi:putative DNA primase/helicase
LAANNGTGFLNVVGPDWAMARGLSIIPVGADKKPVITSWKPYQERKPTASELSSWNGLDPPAWAMVTGAVSGRIVLDFDGAQGTATMRKLNVEPHRQTPSGGYHADFVHPGWYVPSLNGKSKRALGANWPGLDIRADGGYAIFTGRISRGEYVWLRKDEPYSLDILPLELRSFLGLVKPVKTMNTLPNVEGRPDPERLIRIALDKISSDGRNNAGFWLAGQLRDNGYARAEAAVAMEHYRTRTPATNTKGEPEGYTETEVAATLEQVYSRAARQPWRSAQSAPNVGQTNPGFQASTKSTRAFDLRADGVFCVDLTGAKADTWICPPLEIAASCCDFNDEGYGKLLLFRSRHGQERRCMIPHATLIRDGNEGLQRLLSMGFKPKRDRKSLELLKDYIYETEPDKNIRCVSKIGWNEHCFVFPDNNIRPKGSSTEALFHSAFPPDHSYRTAGTLEEWRHSVARPCVGNSRLVFAISVAFAASLLDLVKADGAGFHLRGLSSSGKTTALLVAGSVWGGGGQNGFLDTWRATANGLEAKGTLHNHALLCLDEIGEVSERELGEIVYALGNGGGKMRMTKYITTRPVSTFKLLYLSSGESSLTSVLQSAGKVAKGGQEVRLIDIEADGGAGMGIFEHLHEHDSPAKFATSLSQAAKTFFGTPIRTFLQFVAEHPDESTGLISAFRKMFLQRNVPRDAVGEVQRVAALFAIAGAAGVLASKIEITGWSEAEVIRSIETVFHSWLAVRGNSNIHTDVEMGMRRTRAFLETNGSSRFQDTNSTGEKTINRAGFREHGADGWRYYLYPSTFQNEVCAHYDCRAVLKEMARRGFATPSSDGRHLGNKKTITGEGRPRVIEILPTFLDEENCIVGQVG